jgi:IS1 family transposase
MNQLSLERRAQIVRCLSEGNSVRATSRLTGASRTTVLSLLVDLGELCRTYQDHVLRGIRAKRIECDEIWSFVGAKQRQVLSGATGAGDVWTWTALDADSKLMISWRVGQRDFTQARAFMADLASRLANRVQITTDGLPWYRQAVERAFGWNGTDYAMLVKQYAREPQQHTTRYSPAICVGAEKTWVMGNPDFDHVSTSYVERQNLGMRMQMRRFTRLTNAFSRKVENHAYAVDIHFMVYNFARPHGTLTKAHPLHYPTSPAMAAGVADHLWTIEEICGLLDPARLIGAL